MDQNDKNWYGNDIDPFEQVEKAHLNSVETLSFNPACPTELVTGSHDKTIKTWDITKMKNTSVLQGHTEGVWSTQFSVDGKVLLSGGPDKTVLLWDLKKKKPVQSLKEHKNKVYYANFNENSKLIASGGEDSRLIIWDLRKGSPLKIIKSDNKIVYSCKWSKCGKFLFSTEYGGIVKVYDTQKFQLLDQFGKYQESNRAWTCDVDFRQNSKTGSNIYVGFENQKSMKVLDFDQQQGKFSLNYEFVAHLDPIKNITVDGPRGLMVTGCRDGSSRIWETEKSGDAQSGFRNRTIANLNGHADNVSCCEFMPGNQGNVLATGSWDQGLRLFKW